jgi:riboflavin biosynthesis pyrimidine reductase
LSSTVCSKGFYCGYLGLTNRLLVEGGGSVCWVFLDAGPCNIFKQ